MNGQILEYFGKAHAGYLHARGKIATNKIIELLKPTSPKENILEVGFGTGTTLIQLASKYKKVNCTGYELSSTMHQTASDRVNFCGISNRIKLTLLKEKNKFPAADNTFDKVYAESILAIQEGDDLKNILQEIQRVLKPNGMFVFNETIWLESTDRMKAKQINENGKKLFGIIQANHHYTYYKDWKKLLEETGFECQFKLPVSEITISSKSILIPVPVILSRIFSKIGSLKARISPSMIKEWNEHKKSMSSVNTNEKLMEGLIVMAIKKI